MVKKSLYEGFIPSTAVYLIVSLIAFFPCLFFGQAYSNFDLLNVYSIDQQFLKSSLLQGHLPFWNPYLFAGQPFLADPNAMVLYPFLYLCLFLPQAACFGWFFFLHVFLAMLGMDFWLKSLGLRPESRWIGSLSYALGGCFWLEIDHPIIFAALAWAPWFFAGLERFVRFPGYRTAFASGLFLALLGSTLHPQILLGVFYAGLVYFIVRVLSERPRLSHIPRLTLFFVWGALPFFFLVLPFLDFMRFSDRLRGSLGYLRFNADLSIHPMSLSHLLFPLSPSPSPIPGPDVDLLAQEGFCGLWLPLGVILAFMASRAKSRFLLAGLGLFFLCVSFGKFFFLHLFTCRFIPGFSLLRAPFRFIFLYTMTFSALAAVGFDVHVQNPRSTRLDHQRKVTLAVVYSGLWIAVLLTGTPMASPFKELSLAGSGGLILWFSSDKWGKGGKWIFLLSFLLSMIFTGWELSSPHLGPALNLDFTKADPLFSKIKAKAGENRVFMGDGIPYPVYQQGRMATLDLPANTSCLLGVQNAGGYNELSLSARGDLYSLPFLTFRKLMDIQGFATGNEKGQVPGFTRFQWGEVKFYLSREKMKLAYAPGLIEVIRDESQCLGRMRAKNYDPYQTGILSEPPEEGNQFYDRSLPARLRYSLISRGLNEETFNVGLSHSSWVVFSDPNYPGWKAWVDDNPSKIITSNHLFRGVYVPPGDHLIRFRFEPTCVRLAFFGILLWVLSFGFYRIVRRDIGSLG